MRIGVISDLHANARALRRAIELLEGVDRWIVLGDLLTYGCDIDETLALVDDLVARGAVVIRGNHDQLYMDLAAGDDAYYARLPDWLREAVDYTCARLDVVAFAQRYAWCEEYVIEDVVFSHANPFAPRDWRYLNSDHDHADAASRIAARGLGCGVFGHTHRARIFERRADGAEGFVTATGAHDAARILVLNPGSVGQPRERGAGSSCLRLDVDRHGKDVAIIPIDYATDAHVATIARSTMSDRTKAKLVDFFAPGA